MIKIAPKDKGNDKRKNIEGHGSKPGSTVKRVISAMKAMNTMPGNRKGK
jgi:hypothetical protein